MGFSKQWERTQDLRTEGLLGAELFWEINEGQELTASSYIYPDLAELSDFRTISKAELSVDINRARSMSLVSGIEHDYETYAGKDAEKWDLLYYTGLSISF